MTSSSLPPPSKRYKKYSIWLTVLIALLGGGIAYAVVARAYSPNTAIACGAIYVGFGLLSAFSHTLIGTRSVHQILTGIYVRMLLALGITVALAAFFKPAFEPFLLNAVIAIILMQALYIIFSL